MDPVEIILEEYKTLRAEILTAMSNRISILTFGLATIGAIFTASIATYVPDSSPPFASLMLIFGVPAIAILVLFMWLGEYQRMQRAGKFLVALETKVNEASGETLLYWETLLRLPDLVAPSPPYPRLSHMKYPYNTTVMLLITISAISQTLGLVTLRFSTRSTWILVVGALALQVILYGLVASKIKKWRS